MDEGGAVAAMQEALQKVLNDNDSDLGANLLGDWYVVAEVHTAEDTVLRMLSSEGTPIWRHESLLRFALGDLDRDLLVYRLRNDDE